MAAVIISFSDICRVVPFPTAYGCPLCSGMLRGDGRLRCGAGVRFCVPDREHKNRSPRPIGIKSVKSVAGGVDRGYIRCDKLAGVPSATKVADLALANRLVGSAGGFHGHT